MAINFPDSPVDGQEVTLANTSWMYSTSKSAWLRTSKGVTVDGLKVYNTISDLPLSGLTAGQQAFISSSNTYYVSNGSGWYSVTLVNTSPSITAVQDASANTTPFTLNTDGSTTVITVTATDPEDTPLIYSYSVTSGSLNGTTITQSSNVFTITPHVSNATTFELTFTASDGVNTATSGVNSFTLQFTPNWTTTFSTMTSTWGSTSSVLLSTYGGFANTSGGTWYRSGAISVSRDGTKMTISDQIGGGKPVDFTMSTPYDPSTLAFAQTGDINIKALYALDYVEDGTKIYYGDQQTVKYANLSTAFNSNTTTTGGSVLTESATIYDLKFSTDGMKFFVLSGSSTTNNLIKTYNLGAAFDTSSRTLTNTFNPYGTYVASAMRALVSMQFNPTGTVLYVVSSFSGIASTIPLTTAWDLSTAGSYTAGGNFGVGANIQKAHISWDGNWVYGLRDQQDEAVRLYWRQQP